MINIFLINQELITKQSKNADMILNEKFYKYISQVYFISIFYKIYQKKRGN